MAVTINGSTGISGVDGSAGTPALQGSDTNTGISFGSDVILASTGGTERWRVDSSGRLLVGTSSTSADTRALFQGTSGGGNPTRVMLSNASSSPSAAASLGILQFTDNGHIPAAEIEVQRDGGTWTSGSSQPTRIILSTTADGASSPTERMRIVESGDVYIGTTSGTIDSSNAGHSFDSDGYLKTSRLVTGASIIVQHYGLSGEFRILGDGATRNTTGSYGTISDASLKQDITPANSQWADIKAIELVNYKLIEHVNSMGAEAPPLLGVIAQQVANISPGLIDTDENGIKSVKSSVLYMKAVKALQEAMKRIETLESEMAAIKAQLS